MPDFRRLTPDFMVAPQLQPADFAAAKAAGVRTIINNRPDGEAPDQLDDHDARAAAEAAGLAYLHVPVANGGMTQERIAAFCAAVDAGEGPFLAYCRSGTRSCFLWGFSAARTVPADEVMRIAAEAGYDLAPAAAGLRSMRSSDESS